MSLSLKSETKSKYKWIENLSRGYSFNYIWRSSIDLVREGKQKASGGLLYFYKCRGKKKNICENNGDEMMTFLILLFYFIYLLHLYLSFDLLLYRYSVY